MSPSFANEHYVVAKSVEVEVRLKATEGGPARIRIDALDGGKGEFTTRAYIEQSFTLQPTYPIIEGKKPAPDVFETWVRYELPWTSRPTADAAISQGLSFLEERCE